MSHAPEWFRTRPVYVRAHRWFRNGDHPEDATRLLTHRGETFRTEGKVVRYFRHPDVPDDRWCTYCECTMFFHGWLDTKGGGQIVCPGDWIVTSEKGVRAVWTHDQFLQVYEPSTDPTRPAPAPAEGAS